MTEQPQVSAAQAKNPWLSKGVVGGALAAIAGVAMLIGIDFTPADAQAVGDAVDNAADLVFEVVALVGGILAIVGRVTANSKIKFPWQKD